MRKYSIHLPLIRVFCSIVFLLLGYFFSDNFILSLIFYLIGYFVVGFDVLIDGVKSIVKFQAMDEKFLMSIATIGAFFIKEFPEAVLVMLFYQVGEYIGDRAVDKSKKTITSLMDLKSETASLLVDGKTVIVDPITVEVGDIIVVKPGEKVLLDGEIVKGTGLVDTSCLTGESLPREIMMGDVILSGSISMNSVLTIKVTSVFKDSTVSKILDMIENASEKKTVTEKFITKFARIYTPIVVVLALLIFLVPTFLLQLSLDEWLYRSLVFLVLSCPCALVISVPLSFFSGIGVSSKYGILVKGSNDLEALSKINHIVFDKTGTLTKGNFSIIKIGVTSNKFDDKKLLEYAAFAEFYSTHPISLSILERYQGEIDESRIKDYKETAGRGISVKIDLVDVLIGNDKLFRERDIKINFVDEIGTIIYIVIDNIYAGYFVISDEIKDDSKFLIDGLKDMGIKNITMLSGDNKTIVENVASKLDISYYGELLPQDKANLVEEFKKNNSTGSVVFVGDGINDALVLLLADVGISMGGIGSDVAIEASSIVIMDDKISKILKAIKISQYTKKIVWQNIIFAISVKILVLILGAFGYSTIIMAVFADVGVTVLAILNSLRVLNKKYD